MDAEERERLRSHFADLSAEQLQAMLGKDRDQYTAEALALAKEALASRRSDPDWEPPGARVRCPHCKHVAALKITRVFLPSDDPDGVTTFEAQSCRGCGMTSLIRQGNA